MKILLICLGGFTIGWFTSMLKIGWIVNNKINLSGGILNILLVTIWSLLIIVLFEIRDNG